ncbi:hypothetical protein [Spirillospora sp. NPDC047279]|uniref:hypothetical protein n=1 Tax=Spirillospora sp. NPDC047279 TaxID=3155478 RepID=UPI003410E772
MEAGPQEGDYPTGTWGLVTGAWGLVTGAWGVERRWYHICVDLPPAATCTQLPAGGVGEEIQVARVELVLTAAGREEQLLAAGSVLGQWATREMLDATLTCGDGWCTAGPIEGAQAERWRAIRGARQGCPVVVRAGPAGSRSSEQPGGGVVVPPVDPVHVGVPVKPCHEPQTSPR